MPAADTTPDLARELARQQWLLRALRGASLPADAADWLGGPAAQQQLGLQAYQANAAASATRALASAYPTVQQLLGADAFDGLAQALWHADPPACGDLAVWGAALPGFIDSAAQLAAVPYLGDVARLDWALHQAQRAPDDEAPVTGLALLGSADPAALWLQLRAGHAVVVSAHPLHSLWAAHLGQAADRFDAARQALAAGRSEAVRVVRQGQQTVVCAIDQPTAAFEQDLLQGRPLDAALTAADPAFVLEHWLIDSLRRGALAAVLQQPPPRPPPQPQTQAQPTPTTKSALPQ